MTHVIRHKESTRVVWWRMDVNTITSDDAWSQGTNSNGIVQFLPESCSLSTKKLDFDFQGVRALRKRILRPVFGWFYFETRWVDGTPTSAPQSLSGGSLHLTLVTKWSRSWLWMTYSHPSFNVNQPSHSAIQLFQNLTMKTLGQVNACGQRSRSHWTLKIQVKVLAKVKPIGHIWGLEFNRYVCFSFHGNRTTFGWDIANPRFDLENARSRSLPRSSLMITFEA